MKSQTGASSLIVVIVIGLLMSVSVLNTVGNQRTSIQKQIANHAQISSQLGAWVGVELFKQYVKSAESEYINNSVGDTFSFEINGNIYNVIIESIDDTQSIISIRSSFKDYSARSSSSVFAQIEINESGSNNVLNGNQVFLVGDLYATGRVEIDTDEVSKLFIDGEVTSQNINLLSLDEVRATGNISFNSDENIDFVFSNESVTLSGGAVIGTVQALKNITASGGTGITTALANGYIDYSTSGTSSSLTATGDIILAGGGVVSDDPMVGIVHSNANVYIDNKNSVEVVKASGDVQNKSNLVTQSIIAMGDITCPYYSGIEILDKIESNQSVDSNCRLEGTQDYNEFSNNQVAQVETLTPISLNTPKIDVWKLKDHANFQFLHDHLTGDIQVKVKDMSDINDGVYYLKNLSNASGSQELCFDQELLNCTGKRMCDGYSSPCVQLTHNADKNESQWRVEGHQMASGSYFFDANVTLKLLYSDMSILSAGDITSDNILTLKSMNFSSFEELCENDFSFDYIVNTDTDETNNFTPRDDSNITGFYPTNYCNNDTREITQDILGNVSMLAGGVRDDIDSSNSEFTGGDITLNNLTVIYGSLLAGDNLKTGGLAIVYGSVITLDLVNEWQYDEDGGVIQKDENVLSANLSIISDDSISAGFMDNLLPFLNCADAEDSSSCDFENISENDPGYYETGSSNSEKTVEILNSKYL